MRGKYKISIIEAILGLILILQALGPYKLLIGADGFEGIAVVTFLVAIATFYGIVVIIKNPPKGRKLLIIISVIQIGTITYSTIYTSISLFPVDLAFAMAVLFTLVYSFWQSKKSIRA